MPPKDDDKKKKDDDGPASPTADGGGGGGGTGFSQKFFAQEQLKLDKAEARRKATKLNGCKWAKKPEDLKSTVDFRRQCVYKETVMDWTRDDAHAFLTNFLLPPGRAMGDAAAEKMKKKIDFVTNHTTVDLRVDIEHVLDQYRGLGRRMARPGYVPTEEEAERWEKRPTKADEEAEEVKQFMAQNNLKPLGPKLVALGVACLDDLLRLANASRAGLESLAAMKAAASISSDVAREEALAAAQDDLKQKGSWRPGEAARLRAAERAAAQSEREREREKAFRAREKARLKAEKERARRKAKREAEATEAAEKQKADEEAAAEAALKKKKKKAKSKSEKIAKSPDGKGSDPKSPKKGKSKKGADEKKDGAKDDAKAEGGEAAEAKDDAQKGDLGQLLKALREEQRVFAEKLEAEAAAREASGVVESDEERTAREAKEAEVLAGFEARQTDILAAPEDTASLDASSAASSAAAAAAVDDPDLPPLRVADEVLKEAGMILEAMRESFRTVCEEHTAAIEAAEAEKVAAELELAEAAAAEAAAATEGGGAEGAERAEAKDGEAKDGEAKDGEAKGGEAKGGGGEAKGQEGGDEAKQQGGDGGGEAAKGE